LLCFWYVLHAAPKGTKSANGTCSGQTVQAQIVPLSPARWPAAAATAAAAAAAAALEAYLLSSPGNEFFEHMQKRQQKSRQATEIIAQDSGKRHRQS